MKTEVLVAIVAASSVVIGGLIGSLSTLAVTWLNRRFDDRRHLRQLAIDTAFHYWERHVETASDINKQTGRTVTIRPLENYIVHMLQLADLISSKRITADNVKDELARILQVTDAAAGFSDERTKQPAKKA
jgi:hypothetical protein